MTHHLVCVGLGRMFGGPESRPVPTPSRSFGSLWLQSGFVGLLLLILIGVAAVNLARDLRARRPAAPGLLSCSRAAVLIGAFGSVFGLNVAFNVIGSMKDPTLRDLAIGASEGLSSAILGFGLAILFATAAAAMRRLDASSNAA
jgi:hypothetical protein